MTIVKIISNEEIKISNCHRHLKEGGIEFMKWTSGLLKLMGWDSKDDIKIYSDERMFALFKSGKKPEEIKLRSNL